MKTPLQGFFKEPSYIVINSDVFVPNQYNYL